MKGYIDINSYVSQVYEPIKSSGKSISIQYMSTRWMVMVNTIDDDDCLMNKI
jgi:hypothetical protein